MSPSVDEPAQLLSLQASRNIVMMRDETRKQQAFDSSENDLQSCSIDPQQPHFVSHHTEHNESCVSPSIFDVRTACALGFSQSDPERI